MKKPDAAALAVENILADLAYRKGLGDEWQQIDDAIQQEIAETWAGIIRLELSKDGEP